MIPKDGYLFPGHYDLVTPDGAITKLQRVNEKEAIAEVMISNISPAFVGFMLPPEKVAFNFKSVLAQLGLNAIAEEIVFDKAHGRAEVRIRIATIGSIAEQAIDYLAVGNRVGKLFAADDRRRVHSPEYLNRMFGRADREGRPLLSLGGMQGSRSLTIKKVDGRIVAFITLKQGCMEYEDSILGFLPTLGKALKSDASLRNFVRLHQVWNNEAHKVVSPGRILLVGSLPLHIRTVFARVVDDLLPPGYHHTTANILQPDTFASGDIYELYGDSDKEIYDMPLEFFTLEPHREHVFFADRDQLQECLEDNSRIFETFEKAPQPKDHRAAVFIVKGSQMLRLTERDWIVRNPVKQPFPGIGHSDRQSLMVERYIQSQPSYPFLRGILEGLITSQGVLFSRYFPSPLMKQLLLSYYVEMYLMGIYFQYPSLSQGYFFSQEDRAMLIDLATFGTPVYWADEKSGQVLQYIQRAGKASGMFVPLNKTALFERATFFGIYGSNLTETLDAEGELKQLLFGLKTMKDQVNHPLLSAKTPIALVSGGGPGVMATANKIAKELEILSCANIMDFTKEEKAVVNEQRENPYIEAKMTYRLDQLIERQAEFFLDFPIFMVGGIGTDFEYSLEEVRHKVGARPSSPIILFGPVNYWKQKITGRYQANLNAGTIRGSEWVSNSFFCIQTAKQGLKVFRDFFDGRLIIGPEGPVYKEGFVIVDP